jgi:hypothetical protein
MMNVTNMPFRYWSVGIREIRVWLNLHHHFQPDPVVEGRRKCALSFAKWNTTE